MKFLVPFVAFLMAELAALGGVPIITTTSLPLRQGYVSGGGGPSVWYNAGSEPDTGYNISWNTIWSPVTVSASGTCTKLRIYCATFYSTRTARLALYTGQAGPITGATGTVSITGTGWFEATLSTPAAVTAGTYQVAAIVDSGGVQIGGHADTGVTCYQQSDDDTVWASAPPTPLVTNYIANSNQSWGLGMWVQ